MTKRTRDRADELVFMPLGGVGEIGMNLALYGFGPEGDRKWLMVDCGITFASEFDEPGVELIFPDIRFVEEERRNLVGIVITHAHEDHYGALLELWPKLKAPLYMTPFAAGMLEAKAAGETGVSEEIPVVRFDGGTAWKLGPFEIEAIPVAHSIPEAVSLAIRTPLGLVIHTGDWKVDPTPVVGWTTDFERLSELGDEGVLALICDSTNVLRDGTSPSERDVRRHARQAHRRGAEPRRRDHLRLQHRPHPRRGGSRSEGRPQRRGDGPRHAPRHRRGARMRHARRHAGVPRRSGLRLSAARRRSWRCSPAARAKAAPRSPASPPAITVRWRCRPAIA